MKTTHELAHELLALPDVRVVVELWCGEDPTASMSGYDPVGTAIIHLPRSNDEPSSPIAA